MSDLLLTSCKYLICHLTKTELLKQVEGRQLDDFSRSPSPKTILVCVRVTVQDKSSCFGCDS